MNEDEVTNTGAEEQATNDNSATETNGENVAQQSAEEVEQEINLAEELQEMALTVNAMSERIKQLETSMSVMIESGVTVMDSGTQSNNDAPDDSSEYLFLEDLDYNM